MKLGGKSLVGRSVSMPSLRLSRVRRSGGPQTTILRRTAAGEPLRSSGKTIRIEPKNRRSSFQVEVRSLVKQWACQDSDQFGNASLTSCVIGVNVENAVRWFSGQAPGRL